MTLWPSFSITVKSWTPLLDDRHLSHPAGMPRVPTGWDDHSSTTKSAAKEAEQQISKAARIIG
jgi:hypothetical protein